MIDQQQNQTVREAALEAYQLGFSVLPVLENEKRPAVPTWREFQYRPPTFEEARSMNFQAAAGFGIIGGVQGVQPFDFDDLKTFDAWCVLLRETGAGELLDRVLDGYCDRTANNGRRLLVRVPGAQFKDQPLAVRPTADAEGKPAKKVLIEQCLFNVLAPSQTFAGKPYTRLSGGFGSIAILTADELDTLLSAARALDETPKVAREPITPNDFTRKQSAQRVRPGDDYSNKTSWAQILEPHGWVKVRELSSGKALWRRPGKDDRGGISATTRHTEVDTFHVFSSSAHPFEADQAYTKFAAYAWLNHNGDFGAAGRALAANGYGTTIVTDLNEPGTFEDLNGIYRYQIGGIALIFTDYRYHGGTGSPVVSLHVSIGNLDRYFGDFYPAGYGSRKSVIEYLSQRSPIKLDWHAVMDDCMTRLHKARMTGAPAIDLSTLDLSKPSHATMDFCGLGFLENDSNFIYGLNDAMKSYLALAFILDQQKKGKRIGVCAGEFGALAYAERAVALTGKRDLTLLPMVQPLIRDLPRVRLWIKDNGLDLVVFDSVSSLSAGELIGDEPARAWWDAMRHLGVSDGLTAVSLGHTKKNLAPNEIATPFGSAMWLSQACRKAWYVVKKEEYKTDDGVAIVNLKYHCTRHSHSSAVEPTMIRFTAEDGQPVTFKQVLEREAEPSEPIGDDDDPASSRLKIRNAILDHGVPMSVKDIQAVTDLSRDTVKGILRRHEHVTFQRIAATEDYPVEHWSLIGMTIHETETTGEQTC